MCLAVPGKIEEINQNLAKVNILGNIIEVDISLIDNIKIGDYVMVHAGVAIQKYDHKEAEEVLNYFKNYF